MTYLDKVLYLYPDIQRVSYWHSQADGEPWSNPYEGLVWENTKIAKPTKAELDSLDNDIVKEELKKRADKIIHDNLPKAPQILATIDDKVNSIQATNDQLKISLNEIIQSVSETKVNNDQLQEALKDIHEGMVAIKGFLQEIPGIRDALNDLINNNKGA